MKKFTKVTTFIGNYWKLILLGLAVLIILYGVWHRTDKALFNMLAKQYQQEENQVIKDYADELDKLDKEKQNVQKQLTQIQKERDTYAVKYTETQKKLADLEIKVLAITVPSDLNALITDLRQRGYSSATRAPRPNNK